MVQLLLSEYETFSKTQLFQTILHDLAETKEEIDRTKDTMPPQDIGSLFQREQLFGQSLQLGAIKTFLVEDLRETLEEKLTQLNIEDEKTKH